MSYAEVRRPFEFDASTLTEAYRLAGGVCEACGKPDSKENPLNYDHILPISFCIKYQVFALPLVKSLANCRLLCHDCHRKRNHYDSTEILSLVPVVVTRFVEQERHKNERN
jgi:5-methylcytosine-specific restriction endonuclease McrA